MKACHTPFGKNFRQWRTFRTDNLPGVFDTYPDSVLLHLCTFLPDPVPKGKNRRRYQFRYAARLLLCTFRLPDGNPRIRFFLPTLYMFYYRLIFYLQEYLV